ncbi:MAG: heavy-metal-associated domain-containing protein [Ignavibacteriaceae bacterium]
MKNLMVLAVLILILISGTAQSNISSITGTVEFKVYGNCGMCKSRIEKSLKVDGVESAIWDKDTKMVKVVFNSDKISVDNIHQLVAEVGHDTEMVKAKDENYDKLHSCCKYKREETKTQDKENHESHKH